MVYLQLFCTVAACIIVVFKKKTLKFRTTKDLTLSQAVSSCKDTMDLSFLSSHENLCWLQCWDSIKTEAFWNIIWKASPDHFLSVSGCCLDWNWKKRMSLHLSTGFVGLGLSSNVRTNFMKRSQKCLDSKAPGPVHQKFWSLQENWYFSVF